MKSEREIREKLRELDGVTISDDEQFDGVAYGLAYGLAWTLDLDEPLVDAIGQIHVPGLDDSTAYTVDDGEIQQLDDPLADES
jgi:hypothetical protein